MKIAIISDVHSNLEALEATVRAISSEPVDLVVCLGDIVGYNANPAECIEIVRELDAHCVAGNHDRAVAGRISTAGFSDRAARAVRWTKERLTADAVRYLADLPLQSTIENHLVAVHGTLGPEGGCDSTYLATDELRERCLDALRAHPSQARICAYGHTHALAVFESSGGPLRECDESEIALRDGCYYLVNPGTIGEPRDPTERRATYLVLDTVRKRLSVRRIEYDHTVPALKTRSAGLEHGGLSLRGAMRATVRWGRRWLAT